jgi:hypothetical protein
VNVFGERVAGALRERVEDVRPDLVRLVTVATPQGTRQRRRARAAVSLGSAAGVAAVGVAVAVGSSWAGSSPSGAPIRQPGFAAEPSATPASSPSAQATTEPSAPQHHQREPERAPVTLDLPGWRCTPPADEKFICSSTGHSVVVTWRPGDQRSSWGADPDKTADFVSDVHGGVFVTVVVGPDTPSTDAVEVGQALTWTGAGDVSAAGTE